MVDQRVGRLGTLSSAPHVELRGVAKRYGAVVALAGIDLSLARGSIHGLVGENGAGKTTLGKILAGVVSPDEGSIVVDGRAVSYSSPRDALRDRITIVQQEVGLVPQRTVLENVFLGLDQYRYGFFARRRARRDLRELTERSGFDVPADARVGDLRIPDQQRVEILRAIARQAKLIVVDEATASLTATEAAQLMEVLSGLREEGTTVLYVSHYLKEVLGLVDEVTILRNGAVVRTSPASEETSASLLEAMLGRTASVAFPPKRAPAKRARTVLSVDGIGRADVIQDISFEVREGEIVGLAGLVGSGRSEVARAVFGADRTDTGTISVNGAPVRLRSPRDAVKAGIALVPEDRKNQGLLLRRAVAENVTLPHLQTVSRGGILERHREHTEVGEALRRTGVRPPEPGKHVDALSGGNQQKVLFSKWLLRPPAVLLADEPTRGIDVGAKFAIYELITELAERGMGVLLISSEIEEILGLAHRTFVMWRGRIVAELSAAEMSEAAILGAAFGNVDPAEVPEVV